MEVSIVAKLNAMALMKLAMMITKAGKVASPRT